MLDFCKFFRESGVELLRLFDVFKEVFMCVYCDFVIFFLAKFNMVTNNKEQAYKKQNDKGAEKTDNKFKIKTSGFNIIAAVGYY